MHFKKSEIYVFIFFIGLAFALFSKDAGAEESKWKLMGKSKDMNYLVYYDTASVKYLSKNDVRFVFKQELSEEGIEHFKKNFHASVKEAEAKAGEKVEESETLMQVLIKRETRSHTMHINCATNELRVPPETTSKVNFTLVYEIEAGTAVEKIKNELCKK